MLRRAYPPDPLAAAVFASWAFLALSTCWWIVSRYSMDFLFLMTAAAVPCLESGLVVLDRCGVRVRLLKAALGGLAVYSIAAGVLLGFNTAPH